MEKLSKKGFQIEFHSHAQAILRLDFPRVLKELESALENVSIPIGEIIASGGGEAKATQRLRRALAALHWNKVCFEIQKTINGVTRESISHEVDHVRQYEVSGIMRMIALEIEWNNKDPFFDRDLENFKRLHAEGAISVGIIVTRGESLQENLRALVRRFADNAKINSFDDLHAIGLKPSDRQKTAVSSRVQSIRRQANFRDAWADAFVSDKFGAATTHWRKLADRVSRGVGNPCPLLLIGLPDSAITFENS